MTEVKCHVCSATLLPDTSFCRQCGSPNSHVLPSEEPTLIFEQTTDNLTTQRLEQRRTSPNQNSQPAAQPLSPGISRKRRALMVVGILVAAVAIFSIAAVNRMRNAAEANVPAVSDSVLFYPGATSHVNLTNNDGSRTIQLETTDSLDRVESWYQTNLTFNKTMRLTSSSVVMKNEKVTITLAEENGKTVILIKQLP